MSYIDTMKEENEFLVPDYYPEFSCKMGNCREACCQGWPVSLSMKNYHRLLGLDCSKELRHKLDCAMYLTDHPTEEEYARFNPRFDGNCPLRAEDGKCLLQCELGEEVLPEVCRLYPRGIRKSQNSYKCSCANSCEATLELLFAKKEPISFKKLPLNLNIPKNLEPSHTFETFGKESDLQMLFIEIIQQREYSIPTRLIKLGYVLDNLEAAFKNKDRNTIENILCGKEKYTLSQPDFKVDECLEWGITVMNKMLAVLSEHSKSIHAHVDEILTLFNNSDPIEQYNKINSHFETLFAYHELFFEHMLVNHIFFSCFPFQDRPETFRDEFVALCAIYALLRFLALGWTFKHANKDALIDICASAFRLIEHTDFDRYACRLLKSIGCDSKEKLYKLISL